MHVVFHLFRYEGPEAREQRRGKEKGKLYAKWVEQGAVDSVRCYFVSIVNNVTPGLNRGSEQSEQVKRGEEAGAGWVDPARTAETRLCSPAIATLRGCNYDLLWVKCERRAASELQTKL